jgi:hypothetical protein
VKAYIDYYSVPFFGFLFFWFLEYRGSSLVNTCDRRITVILNLRYNSKVTRWMDLDVSMIDDKRKEEVVT